jgi:Holliday junction resolvase-like predicted endonuclease
MDRSSTRLSPANTIRSIKAPGSAGEQKTYFYCESKGYIAMARNFRSPEEADETDRIGPDGGALCFIQLKTRNPMTWGGPKRR